MPLIDNLRSLQHQGATDTITALRSVELNVTEFCNRTCSFCPRGQPELYPNGKQRMSIETAHNVVASLKEINFNGRIGFVGFGEPMAYPNLEEVIKLFATTNARWIEIVTNGDFLTRKKIEKLADAGCTDIAVSMYDKDITEHLMEMSRGIEINIIPRHCYEEKFEVVLVDRIGIIDERRDPTSSINKQCFLPFYKMFIDWNGDVLVCDNDWGRKGIVGNVNAEKIKDIWLSESLNKYRKHLKDGIRDKNVPCNKCDVGGTRYGIESFNTFKGAM